MMKSALGAFFVVVLAALPSLANTCFIHKTILGPYSLVREEIHHDDMHTLIAYSIWNDFPSALEEYEKQTELCTQETPRQCHIAYPTENLFSIVIEKRFGEWVDSMNDVFPTEQEAADRLALLKSKKLCAKSK